MTDVWACVDQRDDEVDTLLPHATALLASSARQHFFGTSSTRTRWQVQYIHHGRHCHLAHHPIIASFEPIVASRRRHCSPSSTGFAAFAASAMTFTGGGSARPHFVLVPMLLQGHTIPMADMACLLAERGAHVTFITTPVNAARLAGFVADVEAGGLAVRLVELRFPAAEFGLPDGCENMDMVQGKGLLLNFMEACAALREPLKAHLRHSPPCCIVSDKMQWWTGDVARELGVPRVTFNGYCGFSSLVSLSTKQ